MREKVLISVISSIILMFTASAQVNSVSQNNNFLGSDVNAEIMNDYMKGVRKNDIPSGIDGSPFLYDTFKKGTLVFPENKSLQADVRYNIAREEMQVKIDEDGYRILHPGVVVKLQNLPYKMMSYRGEDKKYDLLGYFEILSPEQENGIQLLRKYTKYIRSGKAAAAMQNATPPKYMGKDFFYLKFGSSKPVLVESRTKKFIKLFPIEDQEKLKKFMKENHLKARKKEDLLEIVEYYNF